MWLSVTRNTHSFQSERLGEIKTGLERYSRGGGTQAPKIMGLLLMPENAIKAFGVFEKYLISATFFYWSSLALSLKKHAFPITCSLTNQNASLRLILFLLFPSNGKSHIGLISLHLQLSFSQFPNVHTYTHRNVSLKRK